MTGAAMQPPRGAPLARVADIAMDHAIAVEVADGDARWSFILVRDEDGVRCFENRCPHAGLPLDGPGGDVVLQYGYLVCAVHLASFRATDGAYAGGPKAPGSRGLRPVKIVIEDGVARLAG